jgi:aminopeptidase
MQAAARHARSLGDLVGANATNWLVISTPTPVWAARVFPGLPADEAVQRLWALIFAACRVDQYDPVGAWEAHLQSLAERKAALTARRFSALHYRAPGTDLTVGLPAGHVWMGGRENTQAGLPFCANLPTEEVYTLPHRERVDGVVTSTRPFSYAGGSIEGARLTFANGRVVDYSAERSAELLGKVLETDDGAARLGEVALVPNSSPISRTGQIFHNILFDENASCHFAFGDSYRNCLTGGVGLSDDDYRLAGGNTSDIHLDFMVGSGALDIDGICDDGSREAVLRAGEWVF